MVKNYEMYTDEGNALIQNVVDVARAGDLSWKQVHALLVHTAKHGESHPEEVGAEATDTAVRECVYNELGFYEKDQDFYF
jgi:hypothetical protein